MAAPASLPPASAAAAALLKEGQRQGQRFLDFVNKTGSPYHSVQAIKECLQQSGRQFVELQPTEVDKLRPGGAYYITRNNSSIAAFVIGERPPQKTPPHDRFRIVATHTDSPCLRLRPNCKIVAEGTQQVGVECYGSGLWHTWLDRGLGLAGMVYVLEKGQVTGRLVRIPKPLLFIPSLAIHLRTTEELAAGLKLSKEKELQPILCTEVYEQLLRLSKDSTPGSPKSSDNTAAAGTEGAAENEGDGTEKVLGSGDQEKQKREAEDAAAQLLQPSSSVDRMMPEPLLHLLARELGVKSDAILSWDLCLMDATPGRLCGIREEFVESPRLDNLVSTFAAFDALTACDVPPYMVAVAMGFDHEEVGSTSYIGADSYLPRTWLKLIADGLGIENFEATLRRSCLLSADYSTTPVPTTSLPPPTVYLFKLDMAHAVHPNYPDRHQAQHKPFLQRGLVVKENANQRYATNAFGTALLRKLAGCEEVPLQDFVVRNDCRCGSTVGPLISTHLGVLTADIGVPQWAMHSCREICGTLDLVSEAKLFKAFYRACPQ